MEFSLWFGPFLFIYLVFLSIFLLDSGYSYSFLFCEFVLITQMMPWLYLALLTRIVPPPCLSTPSPNLLAKCSGEVGYLYCFNQTYCRIKQAVL